MPHPERCPQHEDCVTAPRDIDQRPLESKPLREDSYQLDEKPEGGSINRESGEKSPRYPEGEATEYCQKDPSQQPSRTLRKTYYLEEEVISWVKRWAKEHDMRQSKFLNSLLRKIMKQFE